MKNYKKYMMLEQTLFYLSYPLVILRLNGLQAEEFSVREEFPEKRSIESLKLLAQIYKLPKIM